MSRYMLLLLLLLSCIALASADCGCGTKCFAYSDPSRCTRCCTATVKRSLRHGPDGKAYNFEKSFLHPASEGSSYSVPKWTRRSTNDPFLRKLSDILGLMDPFL